MTSDKILSNLEDYQKDVGLRIFYLVVNSVLKRVYPNLSGEAKESMDKIFPGNDNVAKEDFVEKYIPNFEELFKEEAKKIEEEVEAEIEKQV